MPPGLLASTGTAPGGFGIPGLTKTYEGVITNGGTSPVSVFVCHSWSDALEEEINVAFNVEFYQNQERWVSLLPGAFTENWCKPAPLSIVRGQIERVTLVPGASLTTGPIAVQAMAGLKLGDNLRFRIFLDQHHSRSVASLPFEIDEVPTDSTPSRILH